MNRFLRAVLVVTALFVATSARAGSLYVSLYNDNTIVSYDTTAGSPTPTTFASGLNGPNYLAFDSTGNLFVSMVRNPPSVDRFTPSDVRSVFATAGLDVPDGLAFDSAGNLFVANQHSGQIVKFTPGGVGSVFASGLNTPVNVAFDSSGNLFILLANGQIYKGTPGGALSFFGNSRFNSFGLAFDTAGNLFASNYNDNAIYEFTPGGVRSVFATTGMDGPLGLAFDTAGNLYVANYGGATDYGGGRTIERFTPGGVGSVFATTTGAPAELAFGPSAVPEPSSLLLLGTSALIVVGFACRRRN